VPHSAHPTTRREWMPDWAQSERSRSTPPVPWFSMLTSILFLGLAAAGAAIGGVFWATGSSESSVGLLLASAGALALGLWCGMIARHRLWR
jgi:hypothetical protein